MDIVELRIKKKNKNKKKETKKLSGYSFGSHVYSVLVKISVHDAKTLRICALNDYLLL